MPEGDPTVGSIVQPIGDPLRPSGVITKPAPRASTRTDAILAAIRRELDMQRAEFDKAGNLGSVTVTVKMHVGSIEVRRVELSCQKVMRRLNGRDRPERSE